MATTVDDLIYLKDDAVSACYTAVETILAVWGETAEGGMGELLSTCRSVIERDQLYDAADEDDDAVSIEHYEQLGSDCELPDCPLRDPDGKRSHKRRECGS
jgi:hypothetical protein